MKHLSYLWPNQKILTLLQVSFRNVLEGTFALELKINLLRAIFFKKKKKNWIILSVILQSFTSQIHVSMFLVFQGSNYVKWFNVT